MTDNTALTVRIAMDDGVEIAADVAGPETAPIVVFLHGGGQTRHSWDKAFAAVVAEGYRAINFDARGHGESDWSPDGVYTPERRSADLVNLLAGTRQPVAFVGASMGGMTAMRTTAERAALDVRALILVDIVPKPNPAGTERIMNFMRGHLDGFATIEEAADAVSAYNPHRPRPSNPAGLARNLRLRDGRYYWHWDPKMVEAFPRIEPGATQSSMLEFAARVTVPTLLVWGRQSDVVTDESIKAFREVLPDLEIFEVAGAGHMVVGDSNAIFNAGVLSFLNRIMPASSR